MAQCPGCGADFAEIDGPNHKYFGGSAGCWKAYGIVLAREYEDPAYWRVYRLSVDTYAVQHPFNKDRRNVQSVNIHLMALYSIQIREFPQKAFMLVSMIVDCNWHPHIDGNVNPKHDR